MTLTSPPPVRPAAPPPEVVAGRTPWLATVAAGLAVLLAAAPVSAVVQGPGWLLSASAAVGVVVGIGLVAALALPAGRSPAVTVALAQVAGLLVLLTALYSDDGVLGLFPGPAALGDMGALLAGAGAQIDTGTAPVPGTPEILFLVTAALGLLAVAVHLASVGASAPAAGGVPLLAAFAVPAALADDLLPWWTLAAAAAGFGLLLVAPDGNRRQLPGGIALVAGASAVALVVGLLGAFVGTAGRFDPDGGSGGGAGAIGLSPFTALRGQLEQSTPTELFTVRGLPQPTYLRALTLASYESGVGWQAVRPGPGVDAAGPLPAPLGPGTQADVAVENLGFRDYWLPLYGTPVATGGLPEGRWAYDEPSGIAYSARPAEQEAWSQRAFLPTPSAQDLRAAPLPGADGPGAIYANVLGVDPRVTELAQEVTAEAGTPFDRALALQEYFTGPESPFSYDLATAPPAGDDALVEFLTVGRVGYCEQFASAMAVMLRTVGVPARVAVGFTAGTVDGDARTISTSDAHAWVEAWFPGLGWTTFDPTPLTDGRAIVPPYVEEARAEAAAGGQAPQALPTPEQAPLPSATPDATTEDPLAGDVPTVADDGGVPLWPFAVPVVLAALLLLPMVLRARARRARTAAA
ncbi:MAG: transglutaminaseTgpA domain-containing protein, partial [Pseudonocardiales bacterium]|nr:transglutaminaseTgpA domain-containing protein [Pseudonocardiales bacterium]